MVTHPHLAGQLSFRRIIDIPLQTCVAALENGQRAGPDTGLYIGRSLLRGPIQHDRHTGTYRIEVRLARGPLRPLLAMRLHIDRWWGPAARTALELSPGTRVQPAAAYFRAGHLLMDALTRRLVNFHRPERPATRGPSRRRHSAEHAGYEHRGSAGHSLQQGSAEQGFSAAWHSDVGGERENRGRATNSTSTPEPAPVG